MQILFKPEKLSELIHSLSKSLFETHNDFSSIVFVGIQQGGAVLGEQIISELKLLAPEQSIDYGKLDITFYRDDIRKEILAPDTMHMPFDIENKTVILIDDVLFTGRTIKAALDTLLDYGRPAKVELCVLIDRKEHRQFPIQADYVGTTIKTQKSDKVKLINNEVVLISGEEG
ncbi:MAG TPA: bifunctional pyr operon transcriptional regulator/uracil phosphoribosyltransferase PyrR [Chitinophagaceae bacterium]|nr:bifunctional pyr operon transcriptional regulator/uracil phosphoribosyltransferase PyrR [Chitinophagaceae bacterium]